MYGYWLYGYIMLYVWLLTLCLSSQIDSSIAPGDTNRRDNVPLMDIIFMTIGFMAIDFMSIVAN